MSELTIGQLIKIIIGVIVFVVVVIGAYLFFKDYILGFFGGSYGEETPNLILGVLR